MSQYPAAIVGTAFSEIRRRNNRSLGALTIEACAGAAADAGVDIRDVDGLANYPNPSGLTVPRIEGLGVASVNFVARAFQFRELRYSCSITQGTVTATLAHAVHAIAAGACRYALVWRSMHNPPGTFNVAHPDTPRGDEQYVVPYGMSIPIISFGMIFARYLAKFGLTRADLAPFIAANRANAARNPEAVFYNKPITEEEYLSSDIVASPMSYLDCDMPVDGCGALLLARADLARDLKNPPAYVAGAVSLGLERHHRPLMTYESFAESARALASALWRESGFGPEDMQHVNVYDGFSYFVPMQLEAFGYAREGEAPGMIADGHFAPTGKFPLNTSGGALGMGRLHGTPQVIEAVRQVQGRCGERQMHGVVNALAHSGGALTGSGALVLTRDPG